jgi:uncharacterized protein (TIGR03663 family)
MAWLNWEFVAYIALIVASIVAHLWGLGAMAMHHDESIHAWSSWRFYAGEGTFSCWGGGVSLTYCYDPVYHGPSLYVLTLLSYFLFGDGDAQARLPMALAGIGLVASCWWLRPYFGRRGALAAAVLLGFTPALLYYTRFARHDGLMVLWELWMFIGVFRWLDSGRPGWLYLTALSVALAIATHELYYILFFIFGIFVLMRLIAESRFAARLNIGLLVVLGICVLFMVVNPPLPIGVGLYVGEKAFLVASALLLAWMCQRLWDPRPILTERLRWLWTENRSSLWVALAILVGTYTVLYTTFFAYPRGFFDGLYAGLAYWLGTQQDFARGDQPWYYYLMLLPLYEPLAVLAGLGMVGFLISQVTRQTLQIRRERRTIATDGEDAQTLGLPANQTTDELSAEEMETPAMPKNGVEPADPAQREPRPFQMHLVPLLLVFWFFTATIIFSWAGEKMPWLLVHMALPGNLLAAWVIGRLLNLLTPDPDLPQDPERSRPSVEPRVLWLIPLTFVLALLALIVAIWRFNNSAVGIEGQTNLLQGLVPLAVSGVLIYILLGLAQRATWRLTMAAIALTMTVLLGAYTLRASWMVVYEHPDVPIEPMIYTQTSPDVPRYVRDVRELAINLTRNERSSDDVTGGLSMPVILDGGGENGDGSLAWPIQWYLRDFNRINWKNSDNIRENPVPETFEVQMPDGSMGLAPVVMLSKPAVTADVRTALQQHYVQPYGDGGVFNWWFPEGDKCSPQNPGYKRFYYHSLMPVSEYYDPETGGDCGRDISAEVFHPLMPLLWPFLPDNWSWLANYVIYRELPYPLVPGAREMEVWIRQDLVAGAAGAEVAVDNNSSARLRLLAEQSLGNPDELTSPTGATVDSRGRVYVADTGNHRIQLYDAEGQLIRTMGSQGDGRTEFYEPRGLAVDADDNLYVADTWNARIVKYDAEGNWLASWGSGNQELPEGRQATITDGTAAGNAAAPLGFFGPRGMAIDAQGNVYIADTGNKRIVVTDGEGNFLYQFGYAGNEPGAFNEPTGVAIDAQGNLYVADTWNGRVQIFAPQGDGQVSPVPIANWRVRGWQPDTYDDPSIGVAPSGQVYVSIPSRNEVLAANLRGETLLRWGGAGDDPAALNSPSGIAVGPDGGVYVVDRQSNRVLRFDLPAVQSE